MKRPLPALALTLTAVAMTTALTACGGERPATDAAPPVEVEPAAAPEPPATEPPLPESPPAAAQHEAARATNYFATDIYGRLRTGDGNLFFSPYSITNALAMTWAGAKGDTAAELAQVLHFEGTPEDTHEAFRALNAAINAPSDELTLCIANALWGQEGYPFRDDYLSLVLTNYGGALDSLDFINDPEGARQIINQWVEEQTEDRIQDLIPTGGVDSLTRLVLTNAIYFYGFWLYPFAPEATEDRPFHLPGGTEVAVPRMHQTGEFAYLENDTLQALRLPYAGGEVSMLVLLPREDAGLAAIEEQLSPEWLHAIRNALSPRTVEVGLPRFRVEQELTLGRILADMGADRAFTPGHADFSGMAHDAELFISEVIHKAFVEVNEEGTEAAAATGVIMRTLAMPVDPPAAFLVDRPFFFALEHNASGAILFAGRVTDPRDDDA